jgi:arginyl-tRNA synthetase
MAAERLQEEIARALGEMGAGDVAVVGLERPRNPEHGDWATNVAMTLAKRLQRAPRQIAEELVQRIDHAAAGITAAEVAGPGFVNFRLAGSYVSDGLAAIVSGASSFGRTEAGGGRPVLV